MMGPWEPDKLATGSDRSHRLFGRQCHAARHEGCFARGAAIFGSLVVIASFIPAARDSSRPSRRGSARPVIVIRPVQYAGLALPRRLA